MAAMKAKSDDRRCVVGKALGRLAPAERRDMEAILDNGVASHVIALWFEKYRNTKMSTAAVTSHRRQGCSCYKETEAQT